MTFSRTDDIAIEDQFGIPDAYTLEVIHDIELERSGGLSGLREPNLLESAVGSVITAMSFDPGMDQVDAAAKLAFGIMKNHPFADVNKRTALAAAEMTLKGAGYEVVADPEELADAIVDFAANAKGYEPISEWLRAHLEQNPEFCLGDEAAELKVASLSTDYRY
ncbi:hypothetical protein AYJ57_20450 (plasmid) [Salipiger sp. CCB-MM3]|uniref:type II toxin-antitoxin system death-on-curing family toxin n=1 Tax=Salipiger sp. CCB-MM3 TaxID=1792508 RepID=UPI00080A9CAC|nr:type II toxin-antitoxin system death-on-curing family toxin [Salipiger sp. CCB-MM3]ANT62862.1 hypothetical protein AYJ57_20450 [Salipiger sp. CCB-MM3]